ncbi:MAG: hypothetical protein WKF36_10255 [Candidatus Nitrosocosmicus sp.]
MGLLAFTLKSIEEFNMDLMKIFHIVKLITEMPENALTTIGKGMPFNGVMKMASYS